MKKRRVDSYIKDAGKLLTDAKDPSINDVHVISQTFIPARKGLTKADMVERRNDGWLNLYTGIGTTRDKSYHTGFSGVTILDDTTLGELWVGDGFAKKISKVVADDMTREWVTVEEDSENLICNKLESLKAECYFNEALGWMRHYGGSLIVIGINDGRRLYEPVNPETIKSIDWLRVYDRTSVSLTSLNFSIDPESNNYGKPEFFTVSPQYTAPFNVHWSRVLEFKGLVVPANVSSDSFWYWGMSVLQPIWEQIKDLAASERNISKLLYEFVIGKYKIKGLSKLMSENSWETVKSMIDIIDLGKSTIQALLLDAEGDDFSRDSATVTGLPDLIDRFMMFLSGVSEIPVTKLFGRSAAGMNSTGEGDLTNYYDMIKAEQKNKLKPNLQILVNLINKSKEIPNNQKIENPTVVFNSLYQLSETEQVKNRETHSKMLMEQINMGVITQEEARNSMYKNGWSFNVSLDEEYEMEEGIEEKIPETEGEKE